MAVTIAQTGEPRKTHPFIEHLRDVVASLLDHADAGVARFARGSRGRKGPGAVAILIDDVGFVRVERAVASPEGPGRLRFGNGVEVGRKATRHGRNTSAYKVVAALRAGAQRAVDGIVTRQRGEVGTEILAFAS